MIENEQDRVEQNIGCSRKILNSEEKQQYMLIFETQSIFPSLALFMMKIFSVDPNISYYLNLINIKNKSPPIKKGLKYQILELLHI